MKFIIDYSKWRAGGAGRYQIGEGETQLLNDEGFMCCLGQVTLQICPEMKKEDILGYCTPAGQLKQIKYLTNNFGSVCNSRLTRDAMEINDEADLETKKRIERLSGLFIMNGHALEFINLPKELSEEL